MRFIITTIIGILSGVSMYAQTYVDASTLRQPAPTAVVTSNVDGCKFEILGTVDDVNRLFYINKETGEVKLLVQDKYYIIGRQESEDDVTVPGKVNYQLTISSFTVYLLNLNSGVMWYLKSPGLTHYNDRFVLLTEKK